MHIQLIYTGVLVLVPVQNEPLQRISIVPVPLFEFAQYGANCNGLTVVFILSRDKTKFGGQNRLRQKCLHRRCQMDTHRRSSAAAAAAAAAMGGNSGSAAALAMSPESPTGGAIYSGLELARLAAAGHHQQQQESNSSSGSEERHSVFPKMLGRLVVIVGAVTFQLELEPEPAQKGRILPRAQQPVVQ